MSTTRRKTVKPLRAADLAKARGATPPAAEPVLPAPVVEVVPAVEKLPQTASNTLDDNAPRTIKYSQNFDEATHENLELIVRLCRRKLRRHVTKSQVLEALINRTADDASLRDQIIDDLRAGNFMKS
ncbi:MAG: hypothetical protein AB7H53_19240 [Hyphomicrobium sp.]